ncbi:GntR family transcriptional regulator [Prosthecomicrobium hirschii]|uniref:GntR family transcriptional regulator n=1 Tax=Prosthecodimorpha hirschii TaxID=665126 RepID=UPI001128E35C|nr:GntR family transcriptional regulator [Prosthecomicrobium hirschii]TPQ49928.1 GntR family transcriptional regulator [Prosthecomicrobium hirschii]
MDPTLSLREPIAPQLVAKLRHAIVEMTLRPGEALSEKDIASRFGVSRQPVREAFIKLSEAGLLQILPNRGTFVVKISVREVANARFVREAVEVAIARSAAAMAAPADIAGLERIMAEQRDTAGREDIAGFKLADIAFHRAISDIVGCDYAWRIVEGARAQTDRMRILSLPDATPMGLLVEQHQAILDAIAAGRPEAAEATMRRHLREILVATARLAERHPDLFEDTDLPRHTALIAPSEI